MSTREFAQVDVFSSAPYRGNPVAVVLDGSVLDDDEMRLFAQWTNLSETTFILPPTTTEADYRLRIFTPAGELPFAGHPTLGSAHAWIAHQGPSAPDGDIVQECAVGLVTLRRDGETVSFAAPPTIRSGPVDETELERIAAALGIPRAAIIDHQWVDNGPGWAAVRLPTVDEVMALRPDFSSYPTAKVGVIATYPDGSDHKLEVRGFAPVMGIPEDPVTGSLNAALAQWLIGVGHLPGRYRASQGGAIGRAGVIEIAQDETGAVWVGGVCRMLVRGTVDL
jgi:PhzF family phenazine biosynthesis protein